jgi:hypothetical protein
MSVASVPELKDVKDFFPRFLRMNAGMLGATGITSYTSGATEWDGNVLSSHVMSKCNAGTFGSSNYGFVVVRCEGDLS